MGVLHRIRVMIWRLRPAIGLVLAAAFVLVAGCRSVGGAVQSAHAQAESTTLQTVFGAVNQHSFVDLMKAQVALETARDLAAGNPFAEALIGTAIRDYNLAESQYLQGQMFFAAIQAAIDEEAALAGKPVDLSLLHQVSPVPVAKAPPPAPPHP